MRLSYVAPFSRPEHRAQATAHAERAEALGYEAVWMPEAFGSDAFTLLGLIAGRTRRLRLATGIVNVYSRTPALLAQSFATLDEISGGRAIAGLGTSGPIVIRDWHAMAYDKPLTRTRETVEILRLALAGERVDYEGDCFTMQGFRLLIRPVQRTLPIYLATLKPRAVRQTGAIADGWLPTHVSLRNLEAVRAPLVAGAEAAGRPAGDVDMAVMTLAVADADGEAARALCREHLAYYIGGMGSFYSELMTGYGYGVEADAIVAAWRADRRGEAAALVTDEMLADLVIAGNPAECRAAIEERQAAGISHIVAFPPHGADGAQVAVTLDALAPAISS